MGSAWSLPKPPRLAGTRQRSPGVGPWKGLRGVANRRARPERRRGRPASPPRRAPLTLPTGKAGCRGRASSPSCPGLPPSQPLGLPLPSRGLQSRLCPEKLAFRREPAGRRGGAGQAPSSPREEEEEEEGSKESGPGSRRVAELLAGGAVGTPPRPKDAPRSREAERQKSHLGEMKILVFGFFGCPDLKPAWIARL